MAKIDQSKLEFYDAGDFDDVARKKRMEEIKQHRKERMKALAGKYVVATTSKNGNKTVYYQDQKISQGGHWTIFINNSYAFSTFDKAKAVADRFEFGNPKVGLVGKDGNCHWVSVGAHHE